MPILSRKTLACASILVAPVTLCAGFLDTTIGEQTYRDLAENRGVYAAGATGVPIYALDGTFVGTLPSPLPDFDNSVDRGQATLIGGAQYTFSVAHDGNGAPVTFTRRFGAVSGTPFYDEYRNIGQNVGNTGAWNYQYDVRVTRLDKVVTEAQAGAYATDTAVLTNPNLTYMRVGAGAQYDVTYGPNKSPSDSTTVRVAGGYSWLTAGTVGITSVSTIAASNTPGYPSSATTGYTPNNSTASDHTVLPMPIWPGDSGSPLYVYNPGTSRWEFVGGNSIYYYGTASNGGDWSYSTSWTTNPGYYAAVIAGYNSPTIAPTSGGGNISWNTPNASGAGTLTQGASSWSYVGLASNVRGATSTIAADGVSTTAATDAQQDATRNLIFAGPGGTVVLGGSIDMGAGSLTFNSNYTLSDGGVTTRRLNSAGFIISGSVTVTSNLTGAAGDEWRVISDSATAGVAGFVVGGSGNNAADLNLGGDLLVSLNRTGGFAAQDVKINGGGVTVRLTGANQIGGDVIFGHRGGVLDLYGHNWTTDHITHLDYGAEFSNLKANTTSTFTFTGSGAQAYLGGFADGGSVANGALALVYNPTTAAGASWTLNGVSAIAGGVTVSGGNLVLRGAKTLHAGGYVDPDDWNYASFGAAGGVAVASGATFTLADHAALNANVTVNAGGTFAITENLFKANDESVNGAQPGTPSSSLYGHQSGTVALSGSTAAMVATISGNTDQSVAYARNITGTGSFTKNGAGTLTLSGTNTFSGAKTINAGTLLASSVSALGDTTTNKWNLTSAGVVIGVNGATAATVKGNLTTGSVGTLALMGTNPDAAPNLTGYSGLYLGAIGAQSVGAAGTSTALTAWNGTGWNLGGGGGTLTMNLKLSGAGTLNVGNGSNTGVVVLTNANNNTTTGGAAFTGAINVSPGMKLRYTDINALGSFSGGDRIAVAYGAKLLLGTGANAVTVFNGVTTGSQGVLMLSGTDSNAYSFSAQGLNAAALGADGTATYSGTLTAGTGGYKFGGDGALTVSSVLSGTHALSADGQGATGGVTTLSGANTFTGTVTVQGGTVGGVTGAHTLKLGSNTGIGTGNAVVLNDGATLDLNAKSVSIGTLTGTAASALGNSSGTAASLTLNEASSTTMAGAISGAIALVKNGAGTLTLSGANAQTGAVTINAGVLKFGSSTALGAAANAATVVSGATLDVAGFGSANNISIAGTGASGLAAIYNSSSTSGSAIGTLTLTADATLGGAVNNNTSTGISAATLALGGKTLTLTSGRLSVDGTDAFTGGGNVVINSGGVLYLQGNGAGSGSGVTITVKTGGTLDARDYQNSALAAYPALVLDGGTIGNALLGSNGGGAGTILYNGVNVTANGGTLTGANTGFGIYLRLAGVLTGSGALTLSGGKGVEFQGDTSAYTGTATATAGTVSFNPNAATQTFAGILAGSRPVVKNGANTTIFTGANTYTGATTVSAGTLQIGNGGTTGALGTGAVTNNAAIVFNRSDAIAVSNVVSGSGSVSQTGSGTLTLSGANTYSGGTRVSSGTLALGNASALGTGALTLAATGSSVLDTTALTGSATLANAIVLNNTGTTGVLVAGGGGNVFTLSGNITGTTGTLYLNNNAPGDGAAVIALSGDNTFATTTEILVNRGSLRIASATALGAATNKLHYDSNAGSISFAGSYAIANDIDVTYADQNLDTGANNVTLSGRIGGNRNLTKTGSGTLTFTGANTYTGGTTIAQGRLNATSGSLGTGAITVGAGAAYGSSYASGAMPFLNITDTGAATVANDFVLPTPGATGYYALQKAGTGSNLTLSGVISGGGANMVLQLDSPTGGDSTTNFTLSGNNTFAGQLRLNRGYLTLGNANGAGTASIFLQSNANASGNLRFGGNYTVNNAVVFGTTNNNTISSSGYNVTLAGVVSGGANWTKTGAGRLTLSGNNTYTGITTVNAGVLRAGSNTAFGTGAVNAASGGTLSVGALGAGRTLANAITVASGGTLAGSATLTGGVTLAAGASLLWEITGTGGVAGTDFDRLVIAANAATLSGVTLKILGTGLNYGATYWDTSRVFDVVTKSGSGTLTGGFASLDTSGAGGFSGEGVWSLQTGAGGVQQAVWTADVQAVPEPSTFGMIGAGALAAVAMVRRRRRA